MGKFVFMLFMMLSFSSFSQLKDTLEAKKFWADNIANIVSFNKDKILTQIHFPLKVGDKKFTKEQFKPVMDKYLNQDLRNELKTKDIRAIDAWKMVDDEGQTYMLVCYKGIEPQYSAAVLCFLQYNGKWLLNQIDYHKEE
jgi:hypothetical protein